MAIVIVSGILAAIAAPFVWINWQLSCARGELSQGHVQAAVQRLLRLVQYAPNAPEVQYRLAVAQRRAGHLDAISGPLAKAQQLGWDKADIDRQTLLTIAQNGEIDSVHPQLKTIMARGATDEAAEEIYEALAVGFLKTYRLKEAWECLNFWGNWQPKAIFPKIWRADICRRIDSPAAEEVELREILKIVPNHLEARCRLAEVLKDSNRIEESAREFQICLKQDTDRPSSLIGLAECQRRLGNIPDAVALLDRARGQRLSAVQLADVLTNLGQIEADAGRADTAVSLLEQAVDQAPFEAPTLFALSRAYSLAGRDAQSQELLEKSKQVRSLQQRVDEIARILIDHPGSADLRYEAGKILIDLGMKDDGAAWMKTALQMQPSHEQARSALDLYEQERGGFKTHGPKR